MHFVHRGLDVLITFSDGEELSLPRTAEVEVEGPWGAGVRARLQCVRCEARTSWRPYSEAVVKAYVLAARDHVKRCVDGADFHVAPGPEKPHRLAPVALPEVDAFGLLPLIERLGWQLPPRASASVSRFIQEGLDDSMLGYLVAVTHSRREVADADKFRYFCGCAWRVIRGEVDTGYSRG